MSVEADTTIFKATVDDAETVAKLVHRLLCGFTENPHPSLDTISETATTLLESEAIDCLVATRAADAVGVLCLNECASIYAGGSFGEITELYVSPEHRSHGIASLLIRAAKEVAALGSRRP